MNQQDFEVELREQGFQVFYGGIEPGMVSPEHAHKFDYRILVIAGEITIAADGKERTLRLGDVLDAPANFRHVEQVGPMGMAYVAGGRDPAGKADFKKITAGGII